MTPLEHVELAARRTADRCSEKIPTLASTEGKTMMSAVGLAFLMFANELQQINAALKAAEENPPLRPNGDNEDQSK